MLKIYLAGCSQVHLHRRTKEILLLLLIVGIFCFCATLSADDEDAGPKSTFIELGICPGFYEYYPGAASFRAGGWDSGMGGDATLYFSASGNKKLLVGPTLHYATYYNNALGATLSQLIGGISATASFGGRPLTGLLLRADVGVGDIPSVSRSLGLGIVTGLGYGFPISAKVVLFAEARYQMVYSSYARMTVTSVAFGPIF